MPKIDLDKLRRKLDREITFFHFQKAETMITKGIKESRNQQNIFFLNYFLAQREVLVENFVEAIKYFNKALKIKPNDGFSYSDKAICLAELGDEKTSLYYFNQGINKDPNCACLYHNKGWLLNSLAQHNKAIVCFNKALEMEPDRPESLYSLADSYQHLDEPKRAEKYFKMAFSQVKGKSTYVCKNINLRLKSLEI